MQSLTYSSGVNHTWTYNELNRLTNLAVTQSTGTVFNLAYTLSAAGMRTRIAETGGRTVDYTYDNLYRLTSETIAGDGYGVNGRTDYTMDAVGNRTERTTTIVAAPSAPDPLEALQTFAYTDNDWLASHTYDDNGNTLLSGEPGSQEVDS